MHQKQNKKISNYHEFLKMYFLKKECDKTNKILEHNKKVY